MAVLRENRYGKTGVRLMKVTRAGPVHSIAEWTVRVLLEGNYTEVYLHGDNTDVLATDTMKNTVYARAHVSKARSMEAFAAELSSFLLERNERVTGVEVHIESAMWKRLMVGGQAHPHAFMKGSGELATATLKRTRQGGVALRSGLTDMVVLKTAQSGFVGFKRDELTTLPETDDRLLGTAVAATWMYTTEADDAEMIRLRELVRESLLQTFAQHESKSVQQTLYAMGEDVLAAVPELKEITLTMPNRHNLLVDLERFGQQNANEIFVPIDEPSGYIEARVTRA